MKEGKRDQEIQIPFPGHAFRVEEQPELKELYEEAFISFEILMIFKNNKKWKKDWQNLIFRDKIIEIVHQNYPQISDQSKNKVLQLFQDGIELDLEVYSQQRIITGLNEHQKFSFYPNRIVSKRIFELFYLYFFRVITGIEGLSKSTLGILFKKLSETIFEYVICKKMIKGMEYEDSCIKLYRTFTLFTFYLNINLQMTREQIQTLLFKQFTLRVKQGLLKQGITTFQASKIRKFFFGSQFRFHLIIDQFNLITSAIRRSGYQKKYFDSYQNLQDDITELIKSTIQNKSIIGYLCQGMKSPQQKLQQINQKYNTCCKLRNFQRIINQVFIIFPTISALSSCNIQKNLLDQLTFDKSHPKTQRSVYPLQSSEIFTDKNYQVEAISFLIHKLEEKGVIRFQEANLTKKQIIKRKLQLKSKNLTQNYALSSSKLDIDLQKDEKPYICIRQTEDKNQVGDYQQTQILKQFDTENKLQSSQMQQKDSNIQQYEIKEQKSFGNRLKKKLTKVILKILLENESPFTLTSLEVLQYISGIKGCKEYVITQKSIEHESTFQFFRKMKFSINQANKIRIIKTLEEFRTKQKDYEFLRTLFLYNITTQIFQSCQNSQYKQLKIKFDQFKIKFNTQNFRDLVDCNLFEVSIQSQNGVKKQFIKIIFPSRILNFQDIDEIQDTYLNDMVKVQASILMSRVTGKSARGQLIQALLISTISHSKTVVILNPKIQQITQEQKKDKKKKKKKTRSLSDSQIPQKQLQIKSNQNQILKNQTLHVKVKQQENPLKQYLQDKLSKQNYITLNKENIKILIDNIQKKRLYFTPIPKHTKEIKPVAFFQNILKEIQLQQNCSYILLPIKKNKRLQDNNNIDSKQNVDLTSKSIDFVILNLHDHTLRILLFDVSIQTRENHQKITNFLAQYGIFQDKYIVKFKEYHINVQYILINANREKQKVLMKITNKLNLSQKQLTFKYSGHNQITVQSKTQQQQVLKRIQSIVFQDLQFLSDTGHISQKKLFKNISETLKLQMIAKKTK